MGTCVGVDEGVRVGTELGKAVGNAVVHAQSRPDPGIELVTLVCHSEHGAMDTEHNTLILHVGARGHVYHTTCRHRLVFHRAHRPRSTMLRISVHTVKNFPIGLVVPPPPSTHARKCAGQRQTAQPLWHVGLAEGSAVGVAWKHARRVV